MFEFSGEGAKAKVITAVKAKQLPELPATQANDPKEVARVKEAEAQAEIFKEFIVKEIANLPAEFNGCHVTANATFNAGSRQATVTIVGKKLHL